MRAFHRLVHHCRPEALSAQYVSLLRRELSNQRNAHREAGSSSIFSRPAVSAAAALAAGTALGFYLLTPSSAPSSASRPQQPSEDRGDPLLDVVGSIQGTSERESISFNDVPATSSTTAPISTRTASNTLHGPWITDDDLASALQRRAIAENRLRGYLHVKQKQVQTWLDQAQMMGRITKEDFEKEMIMVEDEVNLQTNIIMYGVHDPHARKTYLAQYGCSKWSPQALQTIRKYSPIIEIGAGLGHWQRELQAIGADVLAFDNMKALPVPDVRITQPEFVGKVLKGDESAICKHPNRTLLLVYPGPDEMAAAALKNYKGNTLLYVGESCGGVNASDAFFEQLGKEWECVMTVPTEPFPEGYEKLWVLKRKQPKRGWLW